MKKIIFYFSIFYVLSSCSSEDKGFTENESGNLMSFELTRSFGDYFGDAKMFLYDFDQQEQIDFLTEYDYYDWHKNILYYTKDLNLRRWI
jgi:hypothetical protein